MKALTSNTLLLLILLLICSLNISAHDFELNNIYYKHYNNDKTIVVTYKGNSHSEYSNEYMGDIVIPDSIIYNDSIYYVVGISDSAFHSCSKMTTIKLPKRASLIDHSAFYNCSGLTSITLPDSLKWLGMSTFYGCSNLTDINLPDIGNDITLDISSFKNSAWYNNQPDGVLYLGNYCIGIKGTLPTENITIMPGTKYICTYAFNACDKLKSIKFPESVVSIGFYAFYGCSYLQNISMNDNISFIGEFAFNRCYSLNGVILPNSLTHLSDNTFPNCTNLSYVTIPNGLKTIGNNVFENCTNLRSLTIPNSVTTIGNTILKGCTKLYSLTIGSGVTSIGYDVASPLKTIWLTDNPPIGYTNISSKINYVPNEQYSSLPNATIYPNLQRLFLKDGIKYVPTNNTDNICDAIDCSYNSDAEHTILTNNLYLNNTNFTINKIRPYICYGNNFIKISKINISDTIPEYSFAYCENIKSTDITAKGIDQYAIYNCSRLDSVSLNEGLLKIDNNAFEGCSKLKNISIPNSVKTLGEYSFSKCTSLKNINLGTGISVIHNYTLKNCTSLNSITIPKSIMSITDNVFVGCTSLSDVIFSDRNSTLTLGSNGTNPLFSDCPLDSVYIGGDISYSISEEKGFSPFFNNSRLRVVIFSNNETTISQKEFAGCIALENIKLPQSITTIDSYAFYNCSALRELTIPYLTNSIGDFAFSGCSSLTELSIPNSVNSLGKYAFSECSSMININIGTSITSLNDYIFNSCTSLSQISIPQNIKTVGNYAFKGCSHLKNISILDRDTILSLGSNGNLPLFSDCPIDSVYIGGDISYSTSYNTGHSPFYKNHNLKSILISNNTTSIPDYAFYDCDSLTKITIPSSITSIGNNAFTSCENLNDINIPGSVISIGKAAFSECFALTSVILNNGIKTIGEYCFNNCSNLENIYIPNSISDLGASSFIYCSALKDVILGDSITSIENHTFAQCYSIKSISISNNIEKIGEQAFYYCKDLEQITLGSKVNLIEDAAFKNCSSLSILKCNASTPPNCIGEPFSGINKNTCQLIVPNRSINDYKNAYQWKEFLNINDVSGLEINYNNIFITTNQNEIVIHGITHNSLIEIYKFNGQCIYKGFQSIIPIFENGIYLIKIDNKLFKIHL